MVVGMPLKQTDINQLKAIYREETGQTLSDAEAWAMGTRLIELFRLLLRVNDESDQEV